MRKDRRGIGGFMETMVAMMIVTIAISAFMTVFTYTNLDEPEVHDVSTEFLHNLSIEDDEIVGIDPKYPYQETLRMGYVSMTIHLEVVGMAEDVYLDLGNCVEGHDQIVKNGTVMLTDEDGNRYAAFYEVIAFI